MANPNVSDRSDTSFFTGPIGVGTVLTGPLTVGEEGDSLGFFGESAVSQQSVGASATDATTVITLANNLRTALRNLGLAS